MKNILLVLSLFLTARAAGAQELRIAAASDLSAAFQEATVGFQKQSGIKVKLSFGSSGNFFAQIQNGAPFDLYCSADVEYPRRLEAAGLAEPGSLYLYATGKLVVWVPNGSPIDVGRLGMDALLDPSIGKIAIANPRHAPYGRAAAAALEHFHLYDKVRDKLVLGENISQTAQFVETGNADIGILALSLALSPALQGKGRYWEIPADAYPRLEQAAVVLKSSPWKYAAREFMAYLKGAEGAAIMRRYGFVAPAGK